MKFLSSSFRTILQRSAVILAIAFALLLTGCERSLASTSMPISETRTISRTAHLTTWNRRTQPDGAAFGHGRQLTRSSDRPMSFTDYGTRPSLATRARSASDSAVPIGFRSGLSASSTISIFQGLA